MTGTDSKVEKSRIRNRNHPNPKTYSKTYSGADSRLESLTALLLSCVTALRAVEFVAMADYVDKTLPIPEL